MQSDTYDSYESEDYTPSKSDDDNPTQQSDNTYSNDSGNHYDSNTSRQLFIHYKIFGNDEWRSRRNLVPFLVHQV